MITPEMIAHERNRHFIGEILVVENVAQTRELKSIRKEEARIIAIYQRFCLVYNGKYTYCVKWDDFLQEEDDET